MKETYRCKWMCDGCSTFDEMISVYEKEIARLKRMRDDGWELEGQIGDDYGLLSKRSTKKATTKAKKGEKTEGEGPSSAAKATK